MLENLKTRPRKYTLYNLITMTYRIMLESYSEPTHYIAGMARGRGNHGFQCPSLRHGVLGAKGPGNTNRRLGTKSRVEVAEGQGDVARRHYSSVSLLRDQYSNEPVVMFHATMRVAVARSIQTDR
jgi:hypothetical protein